MSNLQLPLDFKTLQNKSFNDFMVAENQGLISSLQNFTQSNELIFYIWGEKGSGKSHILHAITESNNHNNKSSVVLNPTHLSERENTSLITMFDCICIDKVEKIAGNELLEENLFFWINEIKQTKKQLILASQISHNDKTWQLADLVSRLQSGRTHELKSLNRSQALAVFKNQADLNGIFIDDKTLNYIDKNCSMNMVFLSQLISALHIETLVQKKQATIPLIKKILHTKLVN